MYDYNYYRSDIYRPQQYASFEKYQAVTNHNLKLEDISQPLETNHRPPSKHRVRLAFATLLNIFTK